MTFGIKSSHHPVFGKMNLNNGSSSGLACQNDHRHSSVPTEHRYPNGSASLRGRSNVLTHMQRLEIISLFENQNITKAQLGRMFGVTEGAIRKTIRKKDFLIGKNHEKVEILPLSIEKTN